MAATYTYDLSLLFRAKLGGGTVGLNQLIEIALAFSDIFDDGGTRPQGLRADRYPANVVQNQFP